MTFGSTSDPVAAALWQQRRIMLSGPLDAMATMDLATKLMALDGQSGDDVELMINSRGGPLSQVGALLDVIAMMRARVNGTCIGGAEGTAAIVLACCTGVRRAAPHARITLRCDDRQTVQGSSTSVETEVAGHVAVRQGAIDALTTATGQQAQTISEAIDRSDMMTATEAREFGIVDEATAR